MQEDLNLSLPKRKVKKEGPSKFIIFILLVLVILGGMNLYFILDKDKDGLSSHPISSQSLKELALKLEKQRLGDKAATLWKEFLDVTPQSNKERAKIWFRIGKIYQDSDSFESALASYYRSESIAKISDLESDINRRTQECLEALGKFSALKYELTDRVSVDQNQKNAGEEILAEIGSLKITKSDIDRRIEDQIERQLNPMKSYLSDEQIKKQKEEYFNKFSAPQERLQLLNQVLVEEILYRKAREDKLKNDPVVRMMIKDAERNILAGQAMQKEMADEIKITEGDLKTYYEANKSNYIEEEQALIAHILVKDQKTAETVLSELKNKGSFSELVKKYSLDTTTREKNGKIDSWIKKNGYIPGIGGSQEASNIIFNTPAGEVASQTTKSDKGIHIIKVLEKKQASAKTFKEAQQEVYRALRTKKEQEVQGILINKLREQYNVIIHTSQFKEGDPLQP